MCWVVHLQRCVLGLLLMQGIWVQLEILDLGLNNIGHVRGNAQMAYVRESHLASIFVGELVYAVQVLVFRT